MPIFSRSKKSKSTSSINDPPPQATKSNIRLGPAIQGAYRPNEPSQSNPSHIYGLSQTPEPSQGWSPAIASSHTSPYASAALSVPPPHPLRAKKSTLSNSKLGSAATLLSASRMPDCPHLYQGAALYDTIASKFNAVVTQIDNECFSGEERDLVVLLQQQPMWQQEQDASGYSNQRSQGKSKGLVNGGVSSALTSTNYFSKVNLYANSRLPPNLPPLKL